MQVPRAASRHHAIAEVEALGRRPWTAAILDGAERVAVGAVRSSSSAKLQRRGGVKPGRSEASSTFIAARSSPIFHSSRAGRADVDALRQPLGDPPHSSRARRGCRPGPGGRRRVRPVRLRRARGPASIATSAAGRAGGPAAPARSPARGSAAASRCCALRSARAMRSSASQSAARPDVAPARTAPSGGAGSSASSGSRVSCARGSRPSSRKRCASRSAVELAWRAIGGMGCCVRIGSPSSCEIDRRRRGSAATRTFCATTSGADDCSARRSPSRQDRKAQSSTLADARARAAMCAERSLRSHGCGHRARPGPRARSATRR